MMVIGIKQRIIEDTDGSTSKSADVDDPDAMEVGDVDEDELRAKLQRDSPSSDAMAKFTDYCTCSELGLADLGND